MANQMKIDAILNHRTEKAGINITDACNMNISMVLNPDSRVPTRRSLDDTTQQPPRYKELPPIRFYLGQDYSMNTDVSSQCHGYSDFESSPKESQGSYCYGARSQSPVDWGQLFYQTNQRRYPSTDSQTHPARCDYPESASSEENLPHSNKAYTTEEVDFIRYLKDDRGMKWDDILYYFCRQFPHRNMHQRLTNQCLSARYYRDNKMPRLHENGRPVLDSNGKPIFDELKVRQRSCPGSEGIPFRLCERDPDRVLTYSWVQEEDKMIAKRLIENRRLQNIK
ncbi:hypothetical protein B7463_g6632, partial [Scytalidium lignicola]